MRHAGGMKLRLLVAVTAAALTLTACSSSSDGKKEPTTPDASKGTAEKLVEISPLTGRPMPHGRPSNPVFVVKIENTEGGAPQYGLNKADLVMEELVEGGLTRLAAFYYSNLPSKIGHVRSLRDTDIGIASPVGGQVVASGGAAGTYRRVERAGVKVFSEDGGAPGFSSDPLKVRPYNRLINLKTVAKKAKATRILGPYLPWTPRKSTVKTPAATGTTPAPPRHKTTRAATVRFSNSTSTRWKLAGGTWQRTNGHAAAGQDFKANTMIVMFCRVGDAGYTDPAGNPVPETKFEGSGRALVFHGSTVTEVEWHKPSLDEAITFQTKAGQAYTIDPGKVFFELVPKGDGKVTLG
ncbi:DUF3048 domain-containing protein [Aeromicrobium ginsengisoli]|uniref:DUF3048 domain-containing protein n=2 Tax=Aeromicrobium ginsengisoli TaxID=363867 RepID=A0A5M4FJB6_9ACTN|nr:DUF3048 domain-containing protein [Aeromicrobium ginsengisoli]